MLVKIRMLNSKQAGTAYVVHKSPYVIGRHDQADLRVKSPKVSLQHCALIIKGNEVWVRDLQSTNGTFVNDDPVTEDRRLGAGDRLVVGPAVMEVVQEAAGVAVVPDRESFGSTEVAIPQVEPPIASRPQPPTVRQRPGPAR
jgi:predicted component of type VI protein secretion system